MFGSHIATTQSQIKGLTIANISRESGNYVTITWSNGKIMQGEDPYSQLPLYTYDVEFQDMRNADPILLEAIPRRLPLTLERLATLMGACRIQYDLEEMVYCPLENFDPNGSAPDQTENLKTHWPDLYSSLESHLEGVLYFHFDDVSLLPRIYKMEVVKHLSPLALRKTAIMARNTPTLLAFKPTLPSQDLPEITEESYNKLVTITKYQFTIGEKAAIMLYEKWLKGDIAYGHCCSVLGQASKHCIFHEEGLQFLKDNKIVDIENDKYVFLTEVLQWDESIRKSCETIKKRFQVTNGVVPERDADHPYEKQGILKPLSPGQDRSLTQVLAKNAVASLIGMAGTGNLIF